MNQQCLLWVPIEAPLEIRPPGQNLASGSLWPLQRLAEPPLPLLRRSHFYSELTNISYVYLWLIHVDVWQKPIQCCKAIILQLKKERKSAAALAPNIKKKSQVWDHFVFLSTNPLPTNATSLSCVTDTPFFEPQRRTSQLSLLNFIITFKVFWKQNLSCINHVQCINHLIPATEVWSIYH